MTITLHRLLDREWRIADTRLILIPLDPPARGYRLDATAPPPLLNRWLADSDLELGMTFRTLTEARRAFTAILATSPIPDTDDIRLVRVSAGHYRTRDHRWQITRDPDADRGWQLRRDDSPGVWGCPTLPDAKYFLAVTAHIH